MQFNVNNVYKGLISALKTIYFVPLEAGWVSIIVSVAGSLVLCPVLFILILFTYLVKFLDILWVKLSYVCSKERNLFYEPLNDVDYLMWRTDMFGQPLIMCFFVIDHIQVDNIISNLMYRIENKDAFRGKMHNEKGNKRLFCKIDKSLGRLWYKHMENEYSIRNNIVKVGPSEARYILRNPHLILDNTFEKNLEERLAEQREEIDRLNIGNERLSEAETVEFYSLLFSCEKTQLSLKRPCWRIMVLDNVNWKGVKSSVLIGQFHHAIADGSTLTELINKTILDFPDEMIKESIKHANGVTKSATFWHRWISGLVWAAIAGPITLIKVALQARPERSWNSPWERRPKRSKNVKFLGPICFPLSEVNMLKDKLNNDFFSQKEVHCAPKNSKSFSDEHELSDMDKHKAGFRRRRAGERKGGKVSSKDELGVTSRFLNQQLKESNSDGQKERSENTGERNRKNFSKRITFNDIILSCIASGYTKYVNHYLNCQNGIPSPNSTEISTTPTSIRRGSYDHSIDTEKNFMARSFETPNKNNFKETDISSSIHFDDKSPYSSILKYDSISGSHDLDGVFDSKKRVSARNSDAINSCTNLGSASHAAFDQRSVNAGSVDTPNSSIEIIGKMCDNTTFGFGGISSVNREYGSDLVNICHSNLNIVVTTNNRTEPPVKLDNAFSIIILPIPTCPKVSPSERLRCVFESLQEYRNTSLPIIFIRYIKYTLSVSPFLLLLFWMPHSSSCSIYYSSVPGPKECSFMNKNISDMAFALPLTDNIGLGVSIFTFENRVSVSITYDEDIIINPSLFLETIKQSFDELRSGAFNYA